MVKFFKILMVCLVIPPTFSCDTGLGLITTKITGDVIFYNQDKKPDYVESVWVVAAEKSLFENPSLSDIIVSDRPVNLSKDTSMYEIFVPTGTYIVVAAIWKEKGKDWNYQKMLGIYGFDPINFAYYDENPIQITEKNKVASGYDIICDWGFIFSNQEQTRFWKFNPFKIDRSDEFP